MIYIYTNIYYIKDHYIEEPENIIMFTPQTDAFSKDFSTGGGALWTKDTVSGEQQGFFSKAASFIGEPSVGNMLITALGALGTGGAAAVVAEGGAVAAGVTMPWLIPIIGLGVGLLGIFTKQKEDASRYEEESQLAILKDREGIS